MGTSTTYGRNNAIGPCYIATSINTFYREKGNSFNDYIISRVPAARCGNPQDLAGAAIFLASCFWPIIF